MGSNDGSSKAIKDLEVLNRLKAIYGRDKALELYCMYLEFGDKFWDAVSLIPEDSDIDITTEYVKGILSGIDVSMFNGVTDVRKLREIRKTLEHIMSMFRVNSKGYNTCIVALKSLALESECSYKVLNSLRKFAKAGKFSDYVDIVHLIGTYGVYDWMVIDVLYRINESVGLQIFLAEYIIRVVKGMQGDIDRHDRYLVSLLNQ